MPTYPYSNFFWSDFVNDLRQHPNEIAGAWVFILKELHFARPRGSLSLTLDYWSRIVGEPPEKTLEILSYIGAHNIGVVGARNGKEALLVTPENRYGNEEITVECRRMTKKVKHNEKNRLRQRDWREKHKKPENNANITESTSTSTSTTPLSPPPSTPPRGEGEKAVTTQKFSAENLQNLWNELTTRTPLPTCLEISKKRSATISSRLQEHPEKEYWQRVILKIVASSFCCGQNNRGWTAGFEFLIRPDTHINVLEGKYDDSTTLSAPGSKTSGNVAALKRFVERGNEIGKP